MADSLAETPLPSGIEYAVYETQGVRYRKANPCDDGGRDDQDY